MSDTLTRENLVLSQFIKDDEFLKKVFPHYKEDYFSDDPAKTIFSAITAFVESYKTPPTLDAISLMIDGMTLMGSLHEETIERLKIIAAVSKVDPTRRQWAIDEAETLAKHKAMYNALAQSIELVDGEDKSKIGSVPEILRQALAVGFDTHIGHTYFDESDIAKRHAMYTQPGLRVPFDIEMLNKITGGGLLPKTLNVIAAGTNVGKSLMLCHIAASVISQAKNVLYITMEMAEEQIAQRIDANLLDVAMDDLKVMSLEDYTNAFKRSRKQVVYGELIIKEYPTSGATAGHFRHLIDELRLKKNFSPDLVIIDYLNICASSRMPASSGMYSYVKAIAEELRGLAVECKLPILSATQLNREGAASGDPELTDTSESFGLPQTVDLQIALVSTEELEEQGKYLVKQLKNRYADLTKHRKFTVRVNREKMRILDDERSGYNEQFKEPQRPTTAGRTSTLSQARAFSPAATGTGSEVKLFE